MAHNVFWCLGWPEPTFDKHFLCDRFNGLWLLSIITIQRTYAQLAMLAACLRIFSASEVRPVTNSIATTHSLATQQNTLSKRHPNTLQDRAFPRVQQMVLVRQTIALIHTVVEVEASDESDGA